MPVDEGAHVLEERYARDGAGSSGNERGVVRDLPRDEAEALTGGRELGIAIHSWMQGATLATTSPAGLHSRRGFYVKKSQTRLRMDRVSGS